MKISKLFHWLYAILMLLPFLVFLPNAFYYGFNEHAVAQEKTDYADLQLNFNQYILNGNFSNSYTGWYSNTNNNGNIIISNNECTFNTLYTSGDYYFQNNWSTTIQPQENHKYLYKFDIKLPSTYSLNRAFWYLYSGTTSYNRILFDATIPSDIWLHYEGIVNGTGNTGNYALFRFNYDLNGGSVSIRNCNLFDLTQMYGVGNEPTIEEFNINFNSAYYSYTTSKDIVIKDLNNPFNTNMSITDSMSYAWDSVWQNDLFSWSYGSFLTEPFIYIGNLFNVPVDNSLFYALSYWLDISIIWLTFDLVMYIPLLVHRWLDKGIIE